MSASDVVELTSALVAIDSINPELEPGAAGESEAAAFVADWARDAGLEVELVEATPGRPSVVASARGSGGGRSLLLCGHLDTVGAGAMEAPFEPRIEGDRLHGRGAYDMKAGVAAALVACRDAAALELAGDVVVAAVADEEHASLGVQEVLATVEADAAIVTEPTEMEIVIAHKGFAWLEVEVSGRAAHGSRPHLGVDAIVKAGPILTALGELDARLGDTRHPLLGRGSVHASLISGGNDLATYPERCTIGIERRTLPGEGAPRSSASWRVSCPAAARPTRCSRRPRARCSCASRSRPPRTSRSWPRCARRRRRCSARGRRSRGRASGPTPPSSPAPASRPRCSGPAARARMRPRSGSASATPRAARAS